jgi:exonuclease SbcC
MRPIQITIQGFACFKDKQELDFSGLDLFAVAGPTGAGKSSILDAMIFSLYGKIPRHTGKGRPEIISLGRSEASVVFEFALGSKKFRVARKQKRGQAAAQAQVDEITTEGRKSVTSGITAVGQWIENQLGLTYDAFIQAAVLPQGRFMDFLKATAGERQSILQGLLKLDVYERMHQLAKQQKDLILAEIQGVQRAIDSDMAASATVDIAAIQLILNQTTIECDGLSAIIPVDEKNLTDLTHRSNLTKEKYEKSALLLQLQGNTTRIRLIEQQIASAKTAAEIIPHILAMEEADKRANESRAAAESAQAQFANLKSETEIARTSLKEAKEQALEIPNLEARIMALAELRGPVARRAEVTSAILVAQQDQLTLSQKVNAARSRVDLVTEQGLAFAAKVQQAQVAVETSRFDQDLAHRLDGIRDTAASLREARRTLGTLQQKATAASDQARTQHEIQARTQKAAADADQGFTATAAQSIKADTSLRDGERMHSALILRAQLHVGAPCPVCDLVVSKLPNAIPAPVIEELERGVAEAREAEASARRRADECRSELATANASLEAAKQTAGQAQQDLAAAIARIGDLELQINLVLGPSPSETNSLPIEEIVLDMSNKMQEARNSWTNAANHLKQVEHEFASTKHEAESARQELSAADTLYSHKQKDIVNLEAELSGLNMQISSVSSSPEPLSELEKLVERKRAIEVFATNIDNQCREKEIFLAQATAEAQVLDQAAVSAKELAVAKRTAVDLLISETQFADVSAIRQSILAPEDMIKLDTEVRHFHSTLQSLNTRISEIDLNLNGFEVSEQQVVAESTALTTKRSKLEEGRTSIARMHQQISEAAQRQERLKSLTESVASKRAEQLIVSELAENLRNSQFPAYALQENFHALASGASKRLEELSNGRYRFSFVDGEFHVQDMDNAGELRSTNTLSGGETFLASLALALQLSEQVQGACGTVPLDCLFIDEGFGSLDPEALETTTSALEGLPIGNRLVGIITHIRALTERLPARVHVDRNPEGSQLRREE